MPGIPTLYRGTRFRSRLEARWAAFFDILDWKWDYEPIDLDGWIPDFVLHGAAPVLVEVKPIWGFDDTVARKMFAAAVASHRTEELLLLGARRPAGHLGWLCDRQWFPDATEFDDQMWGPAPFCGGGRSIGFYHSVHSFKDRISGFYDGTAGCRLDIPLEKLAVAWAEAGNTVQWRGRAA